MGDWYQWAVFLLTPITGVITWYVGRHKRTSDTLTEMQKTIDLLIDKNNELYQQVLFLRKENSVLSANVAYLTTELNKFKQNEDDIYSENQRGKRRQGQGGETGQPHSESNQDARPQ